MSEVSPFFSICIPQYNRTSFLIEALRVLSVQTFKDFEVCISDDCSPDGRQSEVEQALQEFGLRHVYYQQPRNLQYDGNLRGAIELASGQYCILMGNDDCLAAEDALDRLFELARRRENVGVMITNYRTAATGSVGRRVSATRVVAGGPKSASRCFRNFSFVSGVVLRRDRAAAHATAQWDGAEMYQMYIGCRILSEGYDLLEVADVLVIQGLRVPGETVDSYAAKPRLHPCPIEERKTPLVQMGRLVFDAIRPHSTGHLAGLASSVFLQILLFPYAFWIIEYRRVQSWRFALGICLGMRPRNLLAAIRLPWPQLWSLRLVYCGVTFAGLAAPIPLFDSLRPRLYALAKNILH
jgi:glycosyltransferase involved in cell wall biosynthesis